MAAPFGPKDPVEAEAGDAFLVARGSGAELEVEKILCDAPTLTALIAAALDAYLGSSAWRTGGGGGGGGGFLSGSGAPSGGTGADGDFYIRTSPYTIYGPKSGGAWPAGVGLVGPAGGAGSAGAAGADGRTILSGSAAPGAGIGANGDFYLNTATSMLYGPKAAGAWPAGVSLKGAAGADGLAGADGDDGRQVELQKGATHVQWRYAGDTTWNNLIAVADLVGSAGPAGAGGSPGGTGAAGADGRTILSGSAAPGAGIGANGDFFVNTAASVLYGPKAGGTWPAGVSLVGPAGAAGGAGAAGSSVRNGTGSPGSGVGANGDFYIDTADWVIYGPKTGGAWGGGSFMMPQVEVVTALPGSPDPRTFYVIAA